LDPPRPIQAAIADSANTRVSFWICLPLFIEIAVFAAWAWNKDGRKFGAAKPIQCTEEYQDEYPAAELGFAGEDKKDDTDFLEKKSSA
jgi:hypothetical protein